MKTYATFSFVCALLFCITIAHADLTTGLIVYYPLRVAKV